MLSGLTIVSSALEVCSAIAHNVTFSVPASGACQYHCRVMRLFLEVVFIESTMKAGLLRALLKYLSSREGLS